MKSGEPSRLASVLLDGCSISVKRLSRLLVTESGSILGRKDSLKIGGVLMSKEI